MPYLDIVFFDSLQDLKLLGKKLSQELAVCRAFRNDFELKQLKERLSGSGVRVCHLMQSANQQELQKLRQKVDFIAVYGKNVQRNKFACSTGNIDFLLMPCSASKKPEFDAGLARLAFENKVCIALSFSEFLNASSSELNDLLRNYIFILRLCKKFRLQVAVFSCARTPSESRQVKDFASFLCLLGLSRELALKQSRGLSGFLGKKGKIEGFEILPDKGDA